jgi:hypothetical protein
MEALKSFQKKNNHDSAMWYIHFALSSWSKEELVEIVSDMKVTSEPIFNEFVRRELYIDAARLSFKNGHFAVAAEAWTLAVQSPNKSEESLMNLFRSWCDSFYGTESCKAQYLFADWLRLYSNDPTFLRRDEFSWWLVKFGPSIIRYIKCSRNGWTWEENLALLQQVVCFHGELKERLLKIVLSPESVEPQLSSNHTDAVDTTTQPVRKPDQAASDAAKPEKAKQKKARQNARQRDSGNNNNARQLDSGNKNTSAQPTHISTKPNHNATCMKPQSNAIKSSQLNSGNHQNGQTSKSIPNHNATSDSTMKPQPNAVDSSQLNSGNNQNGQTSQSRNQKKKAKKNKRK